MRTAVVLAAARELNFSRTFIEHAARRIRECGVPGLEFHMLLAPGLDFPCGIEGLQTFYYPGNSQTELIRNHLWVTKVDRVIRISTSANLGEASISRMMSALDARPDALVFYDWDPAGRMILDGYDTKTLAESFHNFRWIAGYRNPAFRASDDDEYYFLPNIPRDVPVVCCHPTIGPELESIAACRFWFHSVRIGSRSTYSSKTNKFMLDGFVTNVEHEVFRNKSVLELGCWDGGLGSQALDAGARSVHFTDSPLADLDWRYPYPFFTKGVDEIRALDPNREKTIGEAIGSLPLVLRHRDPERTKFSRANCYDLSTVGGSYDVTLLCGILYHIFDPIRAIQEACAVSRDTVIVGTWILEGREPVAYLQDSLETDSYDTTTWFQMSYPFMKMLFAHFGFERSAMLGGGIPQDAPWKNRSYRYMIFKRTFGSTRQ